MGLTKSAIKILLEERNRRSFSGSVLLLGKQDIYLDADDLISVANEFNAPLIPLPNIETSEKPHLKFKGYISEKYLFKSLGFSEVQSLDVSRYENAEIQFDLNSKDIPSSLAEKFDLILDGGTLEHVFNFANAMNNIFKMLNKNGRIVHVAPSSNYMDHGFYMFSPTLFWDFYNENSFEINRLQIFQHTQFPQIDKWNVSNYIPGCLNSINSGGLDSEMYGIICIVTKDGNSTGDRVPQQGTFEKLWQNAAPSGPSRKLKFDMIFNRIMRNPHPILQFIRKYPPLRKCGWHIFKLLKKFQKKGLRLDVAKKY